MEAKHLKVLKDLYDTSQAEGWPAADGEALLAVIAGASAPAPEKLVRLPSGAWVRPSAVKYIDHDGFLWTSETEAYAFSSGVDTADAAAAIINGEKP